MSYAELKGFKDHFGYGGNKINIYTSDENMYLQTVTAYKNGEELASAIFNIAGQATLYTDECGLLTFSCTGSDGTEATGIAKLVYYGTYDVTLRAGILYGVKITKATSDPESRVEYIEDCEGFTPAGMNYDTGAFEWGDWENAFFVAKPCMLKSSGEVDYYLDPDDYSKREDGTASDVADTSYDGNAMVEFPKIWTYYEDDGTYIYAYVSNVQYNGSFNCFAHHDMAGNEIDKIYMPIYDGCTVNSVQRSMSGLTPTTSTTGANEITYATANGDGWYTEVYADRMLVNTLLLIMGKSCETQEVFGYGHYTGGSAASNLLSTGSMDDKGLFWGSNSTGMGVKVFGMENWWGNCWRRIAGLMNSSGTVYYKMTYGTEDGTTVEGYPTTAVTGMKKAGSLSGTSGGYISAEQVTEDGGIFPKTVSGSSATYDCDGCWWSTSAVTYACVGGNCGGGLLCGAFAVALSNAVSNTGWSLGASVSCKPTAAAA